MGLRVRAYMGPFTRAGIAWHTHLTPSLDQWKHITTLISHLSLAPPVNASPSPTFTPCSPRLMHKNPPPTTIPPSTLHAPKGSCPPTASPPHHSFPTQSQTNPHRTPHRHDPDLVARESAIHSVFPEHGVRFPSPGLPIYQNAARLTIDQICHRPPRTALVYLSLRGRGVEDPGEAEGAQPDARGHREHLRLAGLHCED